MLFIFNISFIIVIMKKLLLKKSALRLLLCIFLSVLSCSALFAKAQNMPEELETAVQEQLGPCIVYDYTPGDNSKSYFVNVFTHSDNYNKIYLINTKKERKSEELNLQRLSSTDQSSNHAV